MKFYIKMFNESLKDAIETGLYFNSANEAMYFANNDLTGVELHNGDEWTIVDENGQPYVFGEIKGIQE